MTKNQISGSRDLVFLNRFYTFLSQFEHNYGLDYIHTKNKSCERSNDLWKINILNYTPEPSGPELKQRKKREVPRLVKTICLALVFGIVASTAFQASNMVAGKFLKTSEAKEVKEVDPVESTKLSADSKSEATSDIAEIAEKVMPSVVSITNMSVQQVQSFFGGVQERENKSVGSGIIIAQNDSELLIITNNHVVQQNQALTVSFIDEESVEAQVKGTDAAKDLAVVAVKLSNIKDSTREKIKVASVGNSDSLKVGEPVVAIGNALGYGQSVTSGIISAMGRQLDGIDAQLIQTDAAINPGNSGGALLNAKGEVIGINTAKVATDTVEGMGYAIPVTSVSSVIENLMNRETRTKVADGEQGYLGIEGVDVTSDSADMYNMPTGVYVANMTSGGGAKEAGLTKGSIITELNGITINSMTTLKEQLQYYRAGETVEVTVQIIDTKGDYRQETVEITLGKKPQ